MKGYRRILGIWNKASKYETPVINKWLVQKSILVQGPS